MDELGSKLRDARVAKNLTLEDIAHTTKIPGASLAHLEAGRFEALPAPVFVRGFIRAYARVVGVDPSPFVRLYEATGRPLEPVDESLLGLGPRKTEGRAGDERKSAVERRLDPRGPPRGAAFADPQHRLVPLQPVSERREGSLRGGFALLAIVAVGLLVAAWLLVGSRAPSLDANTNARFPLAPVMPEPIDGLPSLGLGPGTRTAPR